MSAARVIVQAAILFGLIVSGVTLGLLIWGARRWPDPENDGKRPPDDSGNW